MDAVCDEPVEYDISSLDAEPETEHAEEKYKKYQKEHYIPEPHYKRED